MVRIGESLRALASRQLLLIPCLLLTCLQDFALLVRILQKVRYNDISILLVDHRGRQRNQQLFRRALLPRHLLLNCLVVLYFLYSRPSAAFTLS